VSQRWDMDWIYFQHTVYLARIDRKEGRSASKGRGTSRPLSPSGTRGLQSLQLRIMLILMSFSWPGGDVKECWCHRETIT
jgi:hypothetical protein